MSKVIAVMNMTFDGYCDHTAGIADEETHQHYTDVINSADAILYGRTTYQLMEDYWPALVKNPSGKKELDDFAVALDKIRKIIFSRTLKSVEWKTAKLATEGIEEEISKLKQELDGDILLGSPSMIVSGLKHNLIDEYQICVHPVILGKGLTLFKDIEESVNLKLLKTKTFTCGAVVFYYEPTAKSV